MSARILDGAAVAAQIRSELSSRAAAFTRSAGRQPGLGHRACRRQAGLADLREQQTEVRGRRGDDGHAVAFAGVDVARRNPFAGPSIERGCCDRRHSGAGAAARFARRGRDAVGLRCHRSVEGCGRGDAGERRAARSESRGPDRVHAGRHRRAAAAQRHRDRRKTRRRHWPERYRRQAGVDAPPSPPCHRDGLSFPHAGSSEGCRNRRHSGGRARPARFRAAIVRPAWSDSDRRRHQSRDRSERGARDISRRPSAARAVRPQGIGPGRRRASGGRRGRRRPYSRARRRRPADHRDAHGEHGRGGGAPLCRRCR